MTTSKYDPTYREPRIDVGFDTAAPQDQCWCIGVTDATTDGQPFDAVYAEKTLADAACQRIAQAIADRVHGAELARLRAVEDDWIDLVKRLRAAMIDELRQAQMVCGGAFDGFRGDNEGIFDEASMAVSLPISNEDGVPFELLQPVPAEPFKPTMTTTHRGYAVRWGDGQTDMLLYAEHELAEAAADFGERYAAWKATQR